MVQTTAASDLARTQLHNRRHNSIIAKYLENMVILLNEIESEASRYRDCKENVLQQYEEKTKC